MTVLDYDKEAARYDATRGGEPRAAAAAAAITALLPRSARRIVDLGCGTGIVTARLGGSVAGIDRSAGMTAVAAARLPGRVAIGDITRLPLASQSADAVTIIWLLHLLGPAESAAAIAEGARILGPGGVLITTVNKNEAPYHADDDVAVLIRPVRAAAEGPQSDDRDRVQRIAAQHGLTPAGMSSFHGAGQGMSPRRRRENLRSDLPVWTRTAGDQRMRSLDEALAALPDQDRPRADPLYQLLAFRKSGGRCT